jgi:hypothetical protein
MPPRTPRARRPENRNRVGPTLDARGLVVAYHKYQVQVPGYGTRVALSSYPGKIHQITVPLSVHLRRFLTESLCLVVVHSRQGRAIVSLSHPSGKIPAPAWRRIVSSSQIAACRVFARTATTELLLRSRARNKQERGRISNDHAVCHLDTHIRCSAIEPVDRSQSP